MERGPLALFGAIVAVGLGPAMWLGVQVARLEVVPPGPAGPVDQTHADTAQLMGGSAAGGGGETSIHATRPAQVTPTTVHRYVPPSDPDRDWTAVPQATYRPSRSTSSPKPSAPASPSITPSATGDGGDGDNGGGDDDGVRPSVSATATDTDADGNGGGLTTGTNGGRLADNTSANSTNDGNKQPPRSR